jgi:acyl dehydratase
MSLGLGDPLPAFTVRVTAESMRLWAEMLRDPNPIHLDPQAVRSKGLGDRRINQGPANLAYLINALIAAFPGGAIEALDIRFLDNVFEDERVEAAGQIIAIAESGDRQHVDCEVWLKAPGRERVLGGSARIAQPLPGPLKEE